MSYTIGETVRTNFLDERDMAVDGYRVYFLMENGRSDYVEIKKVEFKAEKVYEEIDKLIALHGTLSSP